MVKIFLPQNLKNAIRHRVNYLVSAFELPKVPEKDLDTNLETFLNSELRIAEGLVIRENINPWCVVAGETYEKTIFITPDKIFSEFYIKEEGGREENFALIHWDMQKYKESRIKAGELDEEKIIAYLSETARYRKLSLEDKLKFLIAFKNALDKNRKLLARPDLTDWEKKIKFSTNLQEVFKKYLGKEWKEEYLDFYDYIIRMLELLIEKKEEWKPFNLFQVYYGGDLKGIYDEKLGIKRVLSSDIASCYDARVVVEGLPWKKDIGENIRKIARTRFERLTRKSSKMREIDKQKKDLTEKTFEVRLELEGKYGKETDKKIAEFRKNYEEWYKLKTQFKLDKKDEKMLEKLDKIIKAPENNLLRRYIEIEKKINSLEEEYKIVFKYAILQQEFKELMNRIIPYILKPVRPSEEKMKEIVDKYISQFKEAEKILSEVAKKSEFYLKRIEIEVIRDKLEAIANIFRLSGIDITFAEECEALTDEKNIKEFKESFNRILELEDKTDPNSIRKYEEEKSFYEREYKRLLDKFIPYIENANRLWETTIEKNIFPRKETIKSKMSLPKDVESIKETNPIIEEKNVIFKMQISKFGYAKEGFILIYPEETQLGGIVGMVLPTELKKEFEDKITKEAIYLRLPLTDEEIKKTAEELIRTAPDFATLSKWNEILNKLSGEAKVSFINGLLREKWRFGDLIDLSMLEAKKVETKTEIETLMTDKMMEELTKEWEEMITQVKEKKALLQEFTSSILQKLREIVAERMTRKSIFKETYYVPIKYTEYLLYKNMPVELGGRYITSLSLTQPGETKIDLTEATTIWIEGINGVEIFPPFYVWNIFDDKTETNTIIGLAGKIKVF